MLYLLKQFLEKITGEKDVNFGRNFEVSLQSIASLEDCIGKQYKHAIIHGLSVVSN